MRRLSLSKKTGFAISDIYKPVVIRDERGILFYSTEDILPRATKFNMPSGIYFVDSGSFKTLDNPVKYKLIKLPMAQRWFFPSVKNFKLIFGNNPSKCSIDWDNHEIIMDYSFEEKPWPVIDFILSHEIGHKYYPGQKTVNGVIDDEGEKLCDLFASNRMKIKGYNPSQIGFAQLDSLSVSKIDRKNILINEMIETL